MFDHAPSTPQLKPDTYPTFDLRYVTESAEMGMYNVKGVNRKTTFSSRVLATLVVIGTDCICSKKSNYYTITTTTTPLLFMSRALYAID